MSSFSFWRPVRIATVAVLAAAALFLALLAPAQPSAQAASRCRWISVTGTMTVYHYAGNRSSVIPINYQFGLLPPSYGGGHSTNKRVFTQTVGPVTGGLAITVMLSEADTVSAPVAMTVSNNITELGSRAETLVTPFPAGSSRTGTIYASVKGEIGGYDYAKASFKVTAGLWCPT